MKRVIVVGVGPSEPMDRDEFQAKRAKGRRFPQAKLRTRDIRWIRKVYKARDRECGAAALGRKLGVSHTVIRGIAARKMWRHVQ